MGTALLSGHQTIMLKENQTMFTSLGLGEMGYGLPGAIGAAFACPEKPVLCLNCDGGIMMNLQEAHSIIDNKLNVKIIIFNNDGYLMIKHTQKMLFKGDYNSVNKKTGIGLVAVKNSGHYGLSGYYAEQAVKKNLITMIYTNAPPAIAPHGALKSLFGTNPICFGTPTGSKVPLIIKFPKNVRVKEKRNTDMLNFIDFAPTILSIAGIDIPKVFQGIAFLGNQKSKIKRKYLFTASDRFDEHSDRIRAVKSKRFK